MIHDLTTILKHSNQYQIRCPFPPEAGVRVSVCVGLQTIEQVKLRLTSLEGEEGCPVFLVLRD